MLDLHDRQLLLDALRPPEGYDLTFAIGTTYTLDLLALLTAPLGFTLFELAGPPGAELVANDAVRLLGVLRRYADRIAVFCEAGRIAVPPKDAILFGTLEHSVIEVRPPENGSFHPKVWVLRYERENAPVRYRVLCMSRNLTFDRSWDTMLVLDGELKERRVGYSANRPLADFVGAIPRMTVAEPPERVREWSRIAGDELRRVHFELPAGFDDYAFYPFGIQGYRNNWPFEAADGALVVAPFVSPSILEEICAEVGEVVLVSRSDTLDAVPREVLRQFEKVYAFTSDAVPGQPTADESSPADVLGTSGLHAKLYILDRGWNASVLTGSANATSAAFNTNVEFVAELIGKKSRCGVAAVMNPSGGRVGLRDVLVEYDVESAVIPVDAAAEARHDELEQIRRVLSAAEWLANIEPALDDAFRVTFTCGVPIALPHNARVLAVPVLLPASSAVPLGSGPTLAATFASTFEGLTSFLALGVTLDGVVDQEPCRFVVNARLIGEPDGRRERITQYLLRDKEQVVRFLLMLLAGTSDEIGEGLEIGAGAPEAGKWREAGESSALLEPLLRALDRDPGRLDEIASVLDDLRSTEAGRAKLPAELELVWPAIWEARQALREAQSS